MQSLTGSTRIDQDRQRADLMTGGRSSIEGSGQFFVPSACLLRAFAAYCLRGSEAPSLVIA